MLTDSHCHLDCLDLKNYAGKVENAIAAARLKGVKYILSPGVSLEELPGVLEIVSNDDDLFAAVGVHPSEKKARNPTLEDLLSLGENKKIVALGETGLDYYYGGEDAERKRQNDLFRLHIKAAKYLKKPLILHARDADQDIIEILTKEDAKEVGGVLHCFTGSLEMAKAAVELGFYISFSGIITFRNADSLRDVAKNIPLECIMIETDAPYLAPTPVRGKSNEPVYLPYIADFMAEMLDISYESFANQTTENFLRWKDGV